MTAALFTANHRYMTEPNYWLMKHVPV